MGTSQTGPQTFTATFTSCAGCTGPCQLLAHHRCGPQYLGAAPVLRLRNLTNNIIKPFLELANAGGQAILYSNITVCYWLISEGNAPPTNLTVCYATLWVVSMRYVALS